MSDARLALKNSIYAFLAITTQLLGTSIVFFVIARMPSISIADFGKLTYAFALAQLIVLFFEYGLGPFLSKKIASEPHKNRPMEQSAYGLHLTLMGIGFVSYVAIVSLLGLEPTSVEICYWIGGSVFATTSMRFFYSYYQGLEKHDSEFISTLIEIAVQVSVITLLFFAEVGVIQVAQFYFIGRLVAWACAYLVFTFSEYVMLPKVDWRFWQDTLVKALPFNLTFVAAFAITTLDTIMLQKLAMDNADYQVGLYQAGVRLVLIPTILATVVTRVFLPQLSRMGGNTTSHLQHLNNILLLIGLLAGLFFYFQADYLAVLAYGNDYQEVASILAPLALTLCLRFGAAFNLYFTLREQMWARFGFACIALATLISLNYFLIPIYGVMGTVYASIITHIVYWLPVVFMMQKQEQDPLLGWRWHYAIAIAGTYGILLWLSRDLNFWFVVLASIPFTMVAVAFSIPGHIRTALIAGALNRTDTKTID